MANIYSPQQLLDRKYTTKENFYKAKEKSLILLQKLFLEKLIISGSLFGAAARGDYKRGSDVDIFIATFDDGYTKTIDLVNQFSLEVRDKMNIPLDIHIHTQSSLKRGNTYYDPSFVSHLVDDCPVTVKIGEPLENIICTGWTAKDAVNARMRLARLDLARLQAGLEYHKKNMDSFFLGGLQKLFSRTQHTTRNMLFIKGSLEDPSLLDRTKKNLLELYINVFDGLEIQEIEKEIIDAEARYYDILEKTILDIEEGKTNMVMYKEFLYNLHYLIPLAIQFFDLNIDILKTI